VYSHRSDLQLDQLNETVQESAGVRDSAAITISGDSVDGAWQKKTIELKKKRVNSLQHGAKNYSRKRGGCNADNR
jgi:hypothetical protein